MLSFYRFKMEVTVENDTNGRSGSFQKEVPSRHMTSIRRLNDVHATITSHQRPYDVILTFCACWVTTDFGRREQ